jgi:hypothetical protein
MRACHYPLELAHILARSYATNTTYITQSSSAPSSVLVMPRRIGREPSFEVEEVADSEPERRRSV